MFNPVQGRIDLGVQGFACPPGVGKPAVDFIQRHHVDLDVLGGVATTRALADQVRGQENIQQFIAHAGGAGAAEQVPEPSGPETGFFQQLAFRCLRHRFIGIAMISDQAGRQLDNRAVHGPAELFHQHQFPPGRYGHDHHHAGGIGAKGILPSMPLTDAEIAPFEMHLLLARISDFDHGQSIRAQRPGRHANQYES